MSDTQTIKASEVESLLSQGKTVKVKTKNNEFTEITDFIEKGVIPSYEVTTELNDSIVVGKKHMFWTDQGWTFVDDLVPGEHEILTEDSETWSTVESVNPKGEQRIIDVTVDHPESCYFAHNMLHHNSGKSLIAAHALANTQKKDGLAVYIDTENAVDFEFLQTIGINPEKDFIYAPVHILEDVFEMIEKIIAKVRDDSSDKIVTIVVDSIAGMTTEAEGEASYDAEGFNTGKAIQMSRSMRKITNLLGQEKILLLFTNQVRDNVGVMYGDPHVTPGGKAVPFHSSVRVKMKPGPQIKEKVRGKSRQVGAKIRAKVSKNRLGPPGRQVEFDLYFNTGIDDLQSIFEKLKETGPVSKKSRGWYVLKESEKTDEETGEVINLWYADEDKEPVEDMDDATCFQESTFSKNCRKLPKFKKVAFEQLYKSECLSYSDDAWTDRNEIEYTDNKGNVIDASTEDFEDE